MELSDYILGERIGASGNAELFRASRTRGGGGLCLKRLLPNVASDDGVAARFLAEGRVAAKLLHPNLVEVVDAGTSEGRPCVVMEHVDGPSLAALTRRLQERQELLPIEVAIDLAVQLIRALEHVHTLVLDGTATPLVHGAVRPTNVLVQRDGTVKLTDFGFARVFSHAPGSLPDVATMAYLSPEAALGEPLDPRADQFAAGVVLWELLTGRALFHADEALAVRERILGAPIPPPSSIRKSVPKGLDAVVLRALERDRAARFPSMAALERALEQEVPPLGVDDREARLRDELARVYEGASAAAPSVVEPPPGAVTALSASPAALEVDHTLGHDGYGLTPELRARAIPLDGSARVQTKRAARAAGTRRRPLRAALGCGLVVLLGFVALVALAWWRFSDEVRTHPLVSRWLPADTTQAPPVEPERVLPPVTKKSTAADERKADRLERQGAELLLAGKTRAALRVLREAADLAPARASLHEKLAMTYRALDERTLARRHLERYLELTKRPADRTRARALLDELAHER